MNRLDFGLFLDLATEDTTVNTHVATWAPLVRRAEALGFTSVWAGESYPRGGGGFQHVPAPMLVLAALSQHTTMMLGTAVALLPVWDPLRLAYDGAILDQLSGGRFVLGVGLGALPTWKQFGIDPATVGSRTEEAIAALRALWSGAGYKGAMFSYDGPIGPLPLRAGGPPIWIGGKLPRSARRAAAIGDGYLAGTHFRLPHIVAQIGRYRKALAAAGKTAGGVSANRIVVIAESDEEAWSDAAPYVGKLLRKYAALNMFEGAEALKKADPKDRDALRAAAAGMCLVGSPATVRAALEEYVAAGVEQLQLRPAPGGMPAALAARTIELAGTAVLPAFRS